MACFTLEFTALATWVGGLIVLIGSVIPTVFNTFGGEETGGFFLTRSFEGYNRLVLASLVILLSGITWRAWLAGHGIPHGGVTRGEWIVLGVMAAVAGIIIVVLHPQAAALQAAAYAAPAGEERKAAMEAFFRLHWPMRTLYVLNLGLGIVLFAIRARAWTVR
ncbi:MAG TPA: DUF4149 domain-containing protein [Nitrospiraceae bacterium]|nr:DUF4149 domain-containing protein [Nitrospiraceae bacterium]